MNRTTSRTRRSAAASGAIASILALGACSGSGSDTAATGGGAGDCKPEDIVLIGQVRNETNPYEKSWLDGGDEFAASVDLKQRRLTYGGESPKQQEQIRQELSTGDASCTVMNVLPNGDSDTKPIVKAAQNAGAYVVTQWNKPADLHPTDGHDTWVSHITYDGVESGYQIASAMIEEMGGTGKVIALQGILSTAAAKDRFAGLEKALGENPDVELLDQQEAGFDRTKAFDITKTLLAKHGDEVTGIWAANDDMALGAIQALEAEGMTDKVAVVGIDAVPEAVTAVSDGKMTATVSSDGPWQGGIGLAMGYCALTGELDVADISEENRAFFAKQFLVSKDNAAEFATPKVDLADFKCDNLFDRVAGPVS